jgi:hypothetical protein
MTRTQWHWFIGTGVVLSNVLICLVAWKIWRWRHPVIVQIPERNNPQWVGDAATQIVDSNAATRSHVSSVVDGMHGKVQATNLEVSKLARIIRKIATQFGVNTDDIE